MFYCYTSLAQLSHWSIFFQTLFYIYQYTIGLIGFGHYGRMQYPLKFKKILTSYRGSILMTAIFTLALFNDTMSFLGYFMNTEIIFRLVTLSTDLTFFFVNVVLHVKIIFTSKRRIVTSTDNWQTLSRVNAKAAKLSSRIVKLMMICMILVATAAAVRSYLARKLHGYSRGYVEFLVKLVLLGSYVNSIGNSVLFFTMNTPSIAQENNSTCYK